jgi:hypothetical protein
MNIPQEQGTIDLTAKNNILNTDSDINTVNTISNVQNDETGLVKQNLKRDILSYIGESAIFVWLIGVIIVFSKYMIEYKKFCKYLKRWSTPVDDEDILQIFKLTKLKLDTEDGIKVYDVEFYKANVEYDYEIDAITGNILDKDVEIED